MSIKYVVKEIERFIGSASPEVLAVSGAWGTGKTFTWNKCLLAASTKKELGLQKYSYVSLFGINSLDTLKSSIFENIVKGESIGGAPSIDSYVENAKPIVNKLGRKSIYSLVGVLNSNALQPLQALSYLSVKNTIVCLDDLERMGKDLSVGDVLGLVSQLVESKNCKVVLLLNEINVDSDELKRFKEKVVDVDIEFSPTSAECVDVAFDKKQRYFDQVREYCELLDIRNIRILNKIERRIEHLLPRVEIFEGRLDSNLIHSIVLYTWSYYCEFEGAPPLSFLLGEDFDVSDIVEFDVEEEVEDVDESKKKSKWTALLTVYGYQGVNGFDKVICDAVKNGYCDETQFLAEASKLNDSIKSQEGNEEYKQAWNLYRHSFENNENEVVAELVGMFTKHIKTLQPASLQSIVSLMRDLEKDETASKLVDKFIIAHNGNASMFDLAEVSGWGDLKDQELREKFEDQFELLKPQPNIREVIESIIEKSNSWSEDEIKTLSKGSSDDFYKVFKSDDIEKPDKYVRVCLRFENMSGPHSDLYLKITENTRKALSRIGKESKINRLRVEQYGVSDSEKLVGE